MDLSSIHEAEKLALERWPHIIIKKVGAYWIHSSCPECGGEDRFTIYDNGFFDCRRGDGHCGMSGWLDDDKQQTWTPEEKRLRRIEAEQARQRREQAQIKKRLTALERLNQERPDIQYHSQLDETDAEWWARQGFTPSMIDDYKTGVCYVDPASGAARISYTLPVYASDWSTLKDVRHRLVVEDGGKYRPQMAGLGRQLFNSRWLKIYKELALVEGGKKSAVLSDRFMPTIGAYGCKGFDLAWLKHFEQVRKLYLAFDPDALKSAWLLGYDIKANAPWIDVRVVTLPNKPDDMMVQHGATFQQMKEYFELGRKINATKGTPKQKKMAQV